jgi:hypothetical protein
MLAALTTTVKPEALAGQIKRSRKR